MNGKISAWTCAAVLVCACAVSANAASYQGAGPWSATDIPAGWPGAFDVAASGNILVLSGLDVNELSPTGAFVRTLGSVPNYDAGPEYASFLRLSPDGSRVWVGFTTNNNASDRIYSVPFAGGAADYEATLGGNYDLEFAQVSGVTRAFASGATGFASPNNSIYLLDTVGGAHTTVAELGGYGTGFAFDAAGNLYAMNQTLKQLYRFAAVDVQAAALGGGALTSADADFMTDMEFNGSDITVDAEGNVFFNANDPAFGGLVMVCRLDTSSADTYKYDVIATGNAGYNWTTQIAAFDGSVFVNDYYSGGNVTRLDDPAPVPEPATLVLGSLAIAGFGLWRRRAMTR